MSYPIPSVRDQEQRIVRATIKSAIAAGYKISLDNGGDDLEFEDSVDEQYIFDQMFATDDETLVLRKVDVTRFVRFVFGNDGWDVVCDYTNALENDVMIEPNKISDAYQRILGYSDDDSYSLARAHEIIDAANDFNYFDVDLAEVNLDDNMVNRLKLLLQYYFKDTDGFYNNLTPLEMSIISNEEFKTLKKWGDSGKWIVA